MASGDVLARWQAIAGVPPLTAFAALTRRNNHFVQNFDAATVESIDFGDSLDRRYNGNGVTLIITWMAASAVTGNVKWNAQFERHDDEATDLDADSFAAYNSTTSACPAASGALQYTTITFTDGAQMDSLAVGEDFRLRVTRHADDAADTMAGDAQLKSVELLET